MAALHHRREEDKNTDMIGGLLDAKVIRTNGRRELFLGPLSWPSTDALADEYVTWHSMEREVLKASDLFNAEGLLKNCLKAFRLN